MSSCCPECMEDEIQTNNREPLPPPPEPIVENKVEDISLPPESADEDQENPPPPIEKTYSYSKESKYHIKSTEDVFRKQKPAPVPPPPSPPPHLSPPPEPIQTRSSLLDVLSTTRNCTCEVVVRAVRSHIHMNIGLQEKRDKINGVTYISTAKISSSTKLHKSTK